MRTRSTWIAEFSNHALVCIFFILLSGCISVFLGKDLSWDVANYHYYNPYAFIHNRASLDYWPATFVHLYFTPTLDFASYFLINSFSPMMTQFVSGAIHGLNVCFIYFIALSMLPESMSRDKAIPFALALSLLGILSSHVLPAMGGFENDNTVSLLVLSFILLQIKSYQIYMKTGVWPYKLLAFSFVLLGVGMGFKLTAGIFVLGNLFACFLLPIRYSNRLTLILFNGLFTLFGFLLSSGYWMLSLWHKYHNPVFPFLNKIFHSTAYPNENFFYDQYLPQNIWQFLFYPAYFAIYGTIGDGEFHDLRFLIVFLLFIMYGIIYFKKYMITKYSPHKLLSVGNQAITLSLDGFWLFAFTISSYLVWEVCFGIVRYLTVIAMLSPLLIYLLVREIFHSEMMRFVLLTLFFFIILMTTTTPLIVREPWYHSNSYFDVKLPKIVFQQPKATVLIAYPAYALYNHPKPHSFLIPFFPHQWQFIGIPFFAETKEILTKQDKEKIFNILTKTNDQIYLLTSAESMPLLYRTARHLGLVPSGRCEKVVSDRQILCYVPTLLCPVKKSADHEFIQYSDENPDKTVAATLKKS